MKIQKILFYLIIFVGINSSGQDTISLKTCLDAALLKFPSASDPAIYNSISEFRMDNIKTSWYPSLELNGSASWQSDVVEIDIELPFPGVQFPVSPHDQYRLSMDARQTLFDAGTSKIRQELERIQASINAEETGLNVFSLKKSVCELFFNIQIISENEKSLKAQITRLIQNYKLVDASFKNGILLQTDLYLMEAEIIKVKQNLAEITALKQSAIDALNLRTGLKIEGDVFINNTDLTFPPDMVIKRFENHVFELRKKQLAESINLTASKRLPYAFAFTQLGYGRPGLNILNDEFDTYYIFGAGLKWQLWDWGHVRREKKILELQGSLIENHQESFNQGLEIALLNQLTVINNIQGKIATAKELLDLRTKITSNYIAQLERGVIRTIDYLNVQNEETMASINYETELILLQKAISEYLLLKGAL